MMEFTKLTKVLLSSLSARACRYMYLNVPDFEDAIILSNCPPELIAEYKPQFCSIHIITVPPEYFGELLKFLGLPLVLRDVIVIKSFFITNILSNFKKEELKLTFDNETGFIHCKNRETNDPITIKAGNKKKDKEEDDGDEFKIDTSIYKIDSLKREDVVGSIVNIPYVVDCLFDTVSNIILAVEQVMESEIPSIKAYYTGLPDLEYIHSNWYNVFTNNGYLNVEIEKIGGKPRYMLLMDGLDNPSTKELIKKLFCKKPLFDDVWYMQYIYKVHEKVLKSFSVLTMDNIEIIVTRPYAETILLGLGNDILENTEIIHK